MAFICQSVYLHNVTGNGKGFHLSVSYNLTDGVNSFYLSVYKHNVTGSGNVFHLSFYTYYEADSGNVFSSVSLYV